MHPIVWHRLNEKLTTFLVRLLLSIVLILGAVLLWLRVSLHQDVAFDDDWLDSPLTQDIHMDDPNRLVSLAIPNPTPSQKKQPVMVLVHGFSASTFEFNAFKAAIKEQLPSLMYSSVIMGGHGQDYNAFKNASYADWLAPIAHEVQALVDKGYEQIFLFGVSTGATGILHLMLDGVINGSSINGVFLMDSFIKPKDIGLHAVPFVQHVVKNTRSGASKAVETRHWYVNRPTKALVELLALVKVVQKQLKKIKMVDAPPIILFTAKNDPTADTLGSNLIAKAIPSAKLIRYDSDRHVIIEPQAKKNWSNLDQAHFNATIEAMVLALTNQ